MDTRNIDEYSYYNNTPWWMIAAGVLVVVVALVVGSSAFFAARDVLAIFGGHFKGIQELGSLGDFFGGHVSASVGSITLLVVLFFSYHQAKQQQAFFSAQQDQQHSHAQQQAMLEGVSRISQWDAATPGCPQALRLLDYYARVALKEDKDDLYLLLNTAITGDIKNALHHGQRGAKISTYPFAFHAIRKIDGIREREGREQKKRAKEYLQGSARPEIGLERN